MQIDESGTEAAAATGVSMTDSAEPMMKVVKVNRPYLFLVRDRLSDSVLFVGRVTDPR